MSIADSSETRLAYVNEAASRLWEYSRDELLSMHLSDINPDFQLERWPDEWKEMKQRGSLNFEARHRTKGGRAFPVEITVSHFEFKGRDYRAGFVRDITKRKRVEEALRASEKLAATGRMAARIAHEINNPLAGIKNAFLLIKDATPEDPLSSKYVDLVEREIERIARIVRQMYELYRPEQKMNLKVDVTQKIRDIVALMESSYHEREVLITVDIPETPIIAAFQEDSLSQVVFNLLQNAIDASSPGGVVKLLASTTDDHIQVSVIDQGCGIPESIRSQIFEPFFTTKGDGSQGGLGLGLSISRSLTEAMGGSLDFQSQVGQGTVSRFVLPLHNPAKELKNA